MTEKLVCLRGLPDRSKFRFLGDPCQVVRSKIGAYQMRPDGQAEMLTALELRSRVILIQT